MNSTSDGKSLRRVLRLSPRTLLWGMTLLLIMLLLSVPISWLSRKADRTRHQQQVEEWVQQQGGNVGHIYNARLTTTAPRWLTRSLGVDHRSFSRMLTIVDLANTNVNDLTPLAEMAEMRVLDLSCAPVSDLRSLARMTEMKALDLRETNVSDLTPLAGMTELKRLDLTGTAVSDLTPLAGTTGMQKLCLNDTAVSDLSPLTGMKEVTIFLDKSQQVNIPNELRAHVKRVRVKSRKPDD